MEMDVLGRCPALRRRPLQYWPRRLLHIPTMSSYEKQEGNKYGLHDPVTEPPYATLSYTWARYLRNKSTSASGVRISGIDWETPKIDPNHFTARRLLEAINTIREISQLDYLWIDIACINIERIPDDDLDPEISMQQDIFFDAAAPFVWLSRTDHSYLLHLGKAFSDVSLLDDPKTISTLLQVMADPWFSSLWTLLEAAVRTDAVILSCDCRAATVGRGQSNRVLANEPKAIIQIEHETGETVNFELKGSKPSLLGRENTQYPAKSQHFTLRDLIHLVQGVIRSIPFGDARDRFHEAANKSGLLSFEPFNLLSLYGSAQHRHEMKPGLRMKYIYNQVFGFDGLRAGDTFSQVEDQFNSQLIQRCPVLSQLFIRQTTMQTGSAWRLTTGCKIPDIQFFVTYASSYSCLFTLKVETSARPSPKDRSPVFFRGQTSDFTTVASQWLDNGTHPSHRLLGISFDQCTLSRRDGSTLEVATCAVFPTLSPGGYLLSETSQRECVGNFLNSLGDLEARVLAMAVGCGILPGCRVGIGLVIVPQHRGMSHKVWQRVGICFWAFEESGTNTEQSLETGGLNMSEVVWEVTEGRSVD